MKLAIVVSRGGDDWSDAVAIALAARDGGHDVALFAMDAAVVALAADAAARVALANADCDVVACGTSAHQRGLAEADVGALLGSQDDHAAIVHRADRVLAFT
jgi:hypothetical protein